MSVRGGGRDQSPIAIIPECARSGHIQDLDIYVWPSENLCTGSVARVRLGQDDKGGVFGV